MQTQEIYSSTKKGGVGSHLGEESIVNMSEIIARTNENTLKMGDSKFQIS